MSITADDRGLYIAGVDPRSAATIYVRTNGIEAGRLLRSKDGGGSMQEIAHGGALQGFALADEGDTIYVGGPKDGLLRAAATDDRFSQVSPGAIQCLTSIGATLWACAPTGAGYVLGASKDHGATFAPKLTLAGMRGPLQCAAPSAMDRCGEDWSALRALIGPDPKADAGANEPSTTPKAASARSAADASPPAKRTFGCEIARDRSENAPVGLSTLCLSALLILRRRAKHRQRDLRVSGT